uniref:MADF domain-containing protein n=1 Tax=Ditylenchus dipsaci TaxID=166011 RepID=A0A915CV13_9BILA
MTSSSLQNDNAKRLAVEQLCGIIAYLQPEEHVKLFMVSSVFSQINSPALQRFLHSAKEIHRLKKQLRWVMRRVGKQANRYRLPLSNSVGHGPFGVQEEILKGAVWKKIGNELGKSKDEVAVLWKNLRKYYRTKKDKKASGSAAILQAKWVHYDRMNFLVQA